MNIEELASKIASRYTHRSAPLESVWTFTNRTLQDFADKHAALVLEQAAQERSTNDQIIDGLMGSTIEQTVRADQLHALSVDYAVLCGELSKGLSPLDDEWIQLRDLGERLDELSETAGRAMKPNR